MKCEEAVLKVDYSTGWMAFCLSGKYLVEAGVLMLTQMLMLVNWKTCSYFFELSVFFSFSWISSC